MTTNIETARTIQDFIRVVQEVESSGHDLWFRGHASADWQLVPKLYRTRRSAGRRSSAVSHAREEDDESREAFIRHASDLSDVRPSNEWEWYFVMQHHGVQTRLLDWTEGALIGLYFALRQNKGSDDAAVWALDPWQLNKRVTGVAEVLPPGDAGISPKDKRRYRRWLPERFVRGRWARAPVAVFPGHIMRRIGAQRSCFTIHGSDQRPLELIAQVFNLQIWKIVIPSWCISPVRNALESCGIDETTVFPDLEGLSRLLNSWTEEPEGQPHEGVYTRLAPSRIHRGGVGVFAIRHIAKGKHLFQGDVEDMVWIERKDLPRGPKAIHKLYDDFAVIITDKVDKKTRYGCPLSFNRLTPSWFLNHSPKPNVRCDANYRFVALKDITPGDELTVDYSTYSGSPTTPKGKR